MEGPEDGIPTVLEGDTLHSMSSNEVIIAIEVLSSKGYTCRVFPAFLLFKCATDSDPNIFSYNNLQQKYPPLARSLPLVQANPGHSPGLFHDRISPS